MLAKQNLDTDFQSNSPLLGRKLPSARIQPRNAAANQKLSWAGHVQEVESENKQLKLKKKKHKLMTNKSNDATII